MKQRKKKLQPTDKTLTCWADLYGLKQLDHPTVKHIEEVKLPQTQNWAEHFGLLQYKVVVVVKIQFLLR